MTTLYHRPSENGNNPTEYHTEDLLDAIGEWVRNVARLEVETMRPRAAGPGAFPYFLEKVQASKEKVHFMLEDIFEQHKTDVLRNRKYISLDLEDYQ